MNKILETTWGMLVALFMLFSTLSAPVVAGILAAGAVLGLVGYGRDRRHHRGVQVR